MQKIAVVYDSVHGSTEQYANWISSRLNADTFRFGQISIPDLSAYDLVIFGCPIYYHRLKGISVIEKYAELCPTKRFIVFTVGIVNPAVGEYFFRLLDDNFVDTTPAGAKFFHLRGAYDTKKLNLVHRISMFFVGRYAKNWPQKRRIEQDDMVCATLNDGVPVDFKQQSAIEPLVKHAQELLKS